MDGSDQSAAPRRLDWQSGTVEEIRVETYRVKTFTLRLAEMMSFRAGQHVDVRLTASDGYQAQRSYSIASAPEAQDVISLTIEQIPGGEVSPYFHDIVQPGDAIELRGPIGGPFTWEAGRGGPLLLVAGGSGIVPLMSILRHRRLASPLIPAALLYSSRSENDVIYRDELDDSHGKDANVNVLHTLTRSRPAGWKGFSKRIDRGMLDSVLGCMDLPKYSYVCGPTELVESAAGILVSLGLAPASIRTERFGPSGSIHAA